MLAGGVAALGALSGCGFRPLYLPQGGRGGPAARALAAVYVPVIPERAGQLLRQALQQRLDGAGTGGRKQFELLASVVVASEGLGILQDSSATRVRLTARGPWSLRQLDPEHTVVARGSSLILDGYNILNQQYFAADLESSAALRRIAESLADQIVTQVASILTRRAAT